MSAGQGHVLILGAGHAGGSAAALLRQYGHPGPITLVGDEPIAPYQRPPLSKAWLKGEADADSLALKPHAFYAECGIDFRPGTRAETVHRSARTVSLSSGETLSYDVLILAMGARPMPLPVAGADLQGVLFLRTAADAEALKHALRPGRRLAIVGGGYIGLEAAASARALGAEVVVIEREARLLARVGSEALSDFFQAYHQHKGVRFLLGASVTGFTGSNGQVTGVQLSDGGRLDCDVALVGIGAAPNDALALDCGLECARGVVVDINARTADPAVYAIGDVSHRPLPLYDRMFRLESVPNALEQAKQAAASITGRPPPPAEVPWFWSDQYELKLQIAGLAFDVDRTVLRGDPGDERFAVFHLMGDRLRAVEAVNAPPEFMAGRQLILSGAKVSAQKLADPAVSMKAVGA